MPTFLGETDKVTTQPHAQRQLFKSRNRSLQQGLLSQLTIPLSVILTR